MVTPDVHLASRDGAAVDPDRARRAAREVLDDERFRDDPTPAPLRGPLEWIGDRLRSAWNVVSSVLETLPGPTWVALLVMLTALVALVGWRLVRRRDRIARSRRVEDPDSTKRLDARALEAEADAAERAGDLERALRLRFRAGLVRLDATGAVALRPDLTNREVRRSVPTPTFEMLADDFEVVAYGDRPATPEQLAAARSGWTNVIEEARSR